MENKIYTEKQVNYNKRISRQNSVNCDLITQSLSNYTLSVKAHLVCVKIKKYTQITQSLSNYTLCVKLHTECKSCVSLDGCKRLHTVYKIIHLYTYTDYTQRVSNYYTVKCQFLAFNLEKNTPGRKHLHRHRLWCLWQISGMNHTCCVDYTQCTRLYTVLHCIHCVILHRGCQIIIQ